jgi:lipopolysaccharide/colanic/teichoic acid biosynthesis glycosyltransferase
VTRDPQRRPYDSVKRCLDVAGSAVALVVSAPVQAAVAVLVLRDVGRPVLFRQQRPGLHGEPFELMKFRTMREPEPGEPGPNDAARLTRFGRLLRATSLDELPSLWNVLRGDMSFVGPRPLLMQYLPLYSREQLRRHEVRPGITGLAQVNGRNLVSWPDRFRMDVEYVEGRSLRLDARIVARTLTTVLSRKGVASTTSATMEPFEGDPHDAGRTGARAMATEELKE